MSDKGHSWKRLFVLVTWTFHSRAFNDPFIYFNCWKHHLWTYSYHEATFSSLPVFFCIFIIILCRYRSPATGQFYFVFLFNILFWLHPRSGDIVFTLFYFASLILSSTFSRVFVAVLLKPFKLVTLFWRCCVNNDIICILMVRAKHQKTTKCLH